MLKKRLIFTLLYDNGQYCMSRNFGLQRVGNLNWLLKNYKFAHVSQSLDELIILNVSRNLKEQEGFYQDIQKIVESSFLPVAAGGFIRSMEDAERLFKCGADKIVLNSVLSQNPELVKSLSSKYGAQALIASVDCRKDNNQYTVYLEQGTCPVTMDFKEYIEQVLKLGVGELYLTSMNKDGTGMGFDFEMVDHIAPVITKLKKPLILSGGAGNYRHIHEALVRNDVDAASTANLLNFIGESLPQTRTNLIKAGINLANW